MNLSMGYLNLLFSVSWGVVGDILVSGTPALPRQLAWRHNARGSRTPLRVKCCSHGSSPVVDGAKLLSGGVRVSRNVEAMRTLWELLGAIFLIFFALGRVLGASWAST